jgi:predicted ATPase
VEKAIEYLQRAGQQAVRQSAYVEAINHLTTALGLLQTLPDSLERAQQELTLQIALGAPLQAAKGPAAPETERAYTRAQDLCRQVGETPQLFPALRGLWQVYTAQGKVRTGHELCEQLFSFAQRIQDPALLLEAHYALGVALHFLGEFVPAREHLEQSIALYDPRQYHSLASLYGQDPGVLGLSHVSRALWSLGYPGHALKRSHEALALARQLSHPQSLALALFAAGLLRYFRGEGQAAQEQAEALIALSSEQGFPFQLAAGTMVRGWALAEQGRGEEGIAQMSQGLSALQTIGAVLPRVVWSGPLAESHGEIGRPEEGLTLLTEALALVDETGARFHEAEGYRIKGELLLQSRQVKTSQDKSAVINPQSPTSNPQTEAEACFLKAIEIARRQQAKSWELRSVISLARLWQQQGKKEEAQQTLAEIYNWFTEGFDTKDLQEAKALLEELQR